MLACCRLRRRSLFAGNGLEPEVRGGGPGVSERLLEVCVCAVAGGRAAARAVEVCVEWAGSGWRTRTADTLLGQVRRLPRNLVALERLCLGRWEE
jgi:hypothetical protein